MRLRGEGEVRRDLTVDPTAEGDLSVVWVALWRRGRGPRGIG